MSTTSALSRLDHETLHEKTLGASRREKAATLDLLEHLAEADRRRLFAIRGYSSLWEYVHKALGYSESQASERVSTLRLMVKLPEVREKISAGELTLTSTLKLASFARAEKLSVEQTRAILPDIVHKPSREVERILLSRASVENAARMKERSHATGPETTRLTLEVDAKFMKLLERVRDLKGNPSLSLQDVFSTAMQEYVRKREPKLAPSLRAPEVSRKREATRDRTRHIPLSIRRFVRLRADDRCEYVDSKTGRRCEGRTGLQADHIHPFAKGGTSGEANLRLLCPAHNRWAAIQEYGAQKMEPYFSRRRP